MPTNSAHKENDDDSGFFVVFEKEESICRKRRNEKWSNLFHKQVDNTNA